MWKDIQIMLRDNDHLFLLREHTCIVIHIPHVIYTWTHPLTVTSYLLETGLTIWNKVGRMIFTFPFILFCTTGILQLKYVVLLQ